MNNKEKEAYEKIKTYREEIKKTKKRISDFVENIRPFLDCIQAQIDECNSVFKVMENLGDIPFDKVLLFDGIENLFKEASDKIEVETGAALTNLETRLKFINYFSFCASKPLMEIMDETSEMTAKLKERFFKENKIGEENGNGSE